MQKRGLRYWIVSVLFLFCSFSFLDAKAHDWRAAVVMDRSGRIIYAENADKRLPPASTAKVLTAMVVIDHLPLDKWVRVSRRAASVEPSKAYLGVGRYYRVKDLVYAMLMASANDAAVALAEAVAGSEARFIRLMNRKACRCGAKNSNFRTASGLPAKGQYTTARDLAKIMRYAVKYGLITSALSRKVYRFSSRSGKTIKVVNHNKLLWNKFWNWVKGKTGFTRAAGQCFLGYFHKGHRLYVFSFLGGRTLWDNIKELVRKTRKETIKK